MQMKVINFGKRKTGLFEKLNWGLEKTYVLLNLSVIS